MNRLHPADLRAKIAARFLAPTLLVHDPNWNANARSSAIKEADALLAELARTAKPEPEPITEPREDSIAHWKKRAEKAEAALAKEEAEHLQTIEQRDAYHDQADRLADAIASHLGQDFGDHSSANFPWDNAVDALESQRPIPEIEAERDAAQARARELEATVEALNHLDRETEEEYREWKARAERSEARLAAIDKAREGEPEMPTLETDGHCFLIRLEAYAVQMRDTSAALRVELDEAQKRGDQHMTDAGLLKIKLADAQAILSRYEALEGEVEEVPELSLVNWETASGLHALATRLRARLIGTMDALKVRSKQIGVACDKHDLTHALVCGHCHADAVRVVRMLDTAIEGILDNIDIPERNCSCHISPPCNDCVEWAPLREVSAFSREALTAAAPFLEPKP